MAGDALCHGLCEALGRHCTTPTCPVQWPRHGQTSGTRHGPNLKPIKANCCAAMTSAFMVGWGGAACNYTLPAVNTKRSAACSITTHLAVRPCAPAAMRCSTAYAAMAKPCRACNRARRAQPQAWAQLTHPASCDCSSNKPLDPLGSRRRRRRLNPGHRHWRACPNAQREVN